MAINEHWGTGFEVNPDPNGAVRRDGIPSESAAWTRPTGKVGAHSAEVTENRSVSHELTIGGILGLGGVHLHIPNNTDIRFLDGRKAFLEDIRKGDQVAAIYHQVEHMPFGVADERGPTTRYEAVSLLVSPRDAG
jgi:hypothetical protein